MRQSLVYLSIVAAGMVLIGFCAVAGALDAAVARHPALTKA